MAEFDPPSRMVTRISDDNLPLGGAWTCALAPIVESTWLTLIETGEIYNPIFRFLARFVFGGAATMETYLNSLATKFGESIECS